LIFCLPGTPFVFNGQLNGFSQRLAHHSYELLPPGMSEFERVPSWFNALVELKRRLRPCITQVTGMENGLLRCAGRIKDQQGILFVNLTERPAGIPSDLAAAKGCLRGIRPGSNLAGGQAEFFCLN